MCLKPRPAWTIGRCAVVPFIIFRFVPTTGTLDSPHWSQNAIILDTERTVRMLDGRFMVHPGRKFFSRFCCSNFAVLLSFNSNDASHEWARHIQSCSNNEATSSIPKRGDLVGSYRYRRAEQRILRYEKLRIMTTTHSLTTLRQIR
jgi:hypothetical protein